MDVYDRNTKLHCSGISLAKANYPIYFQALKTERSIAVSDAINDPRTEEFSATYFYVLGINSLLNAPIWLGGKLVEIVCHEYMENIREWHLDEDNFAASFNC